MPILLQFSWQVLGFKTELAPLAIRSASATQDLAPGYGLMRYRFVVPQYVTTFGQTLRVVGSLPELGAWEPQHAPTMTWSESHQWSLECALPQRSFEFKVRLCILTDALTGRVWTEGIILR